jgi:hypothetical protein
MDNERELTTKDCDDKSEAATSLEQAVSSSHISAGKKHEDDIQKEQVQKKHPRRAHRSYGEDDSEDEPGPDVHCQGLGKLSVQFTSCLVGIGSKNTRSRKVDHGIRQVEGPVRWEYGRTKRIARNEFHDSGNKLTNTTLQPR